MPKIFIKTYNDFKLIKNYDSKFLIILYQTVKSKCLKHFHLYQKHTHIHYSIRVYNAF